MTAVPTPILRISAATSWTCTWTRTSTGRSPRTDRSCTGSTFCMDSGVRTAPTARISRHCTIAVDQGDRHVLFADTRSAFKPSAIDFGPDYTPAVLNPETADSAEVGIKGTLDGRQTSYALTAYAMTFRNLVLRTTNAAGSPVLQNAGSERLEGIECKDPASRRCGARCRPLAQLSPCPLHLGSGLRTRH